MTRNIPDGTGEFAASAYASAAYEKGNIAKNTAGVLFGLFGYTSLTTGQWVQVHDAAGLPSNGAVPKIILYVPAAGNFSADFGIYGVGFNKGIFICNSTTGPTLTLGAADTWFNSVHK